MRKLLFLLFISFTALEASATWFDLVAPIMSTAEQKAYRGLAPEARAAFEQNFWSEKSIGATEYFRRVEYVDSAFGSSKTGSGANTDPGRVYLSLGAPSRITHLPSSRTFVPLEIWYYETVPGLRMGSELRLLFFQKNNQGLPQLYSPTLNTLRDLLVPQAGTSGIFGPNDSITEGDIRTKLTIGPAEDEVITAAVGVSDGVKYSGNDEILAKITSPRLMLGRPQQTEVTSKLVAGRPNLTVLQTPSPYGGVQVDLKLDVRVRRQLNLEVLAGLVAVYQDRLNLSFERTEAVQYVHRLDLLPGEYRLMITVDSQTIPYAISVPQARQTGEIVRANLKETSHSRQTPFEFDERQYALDEDGKYAILPVSQPERVTWTIRQGFAVVWRSTSEATEISAVDLPLTTLQPGAYRLEATAGNDSRATDLIVKSQKESPREAALLSYNANLSPASRYASLGHQLLLRGRLAEARSALQSSSRQGTTNQAQIELARVDAMAGQLDEARIRVRHILDTQPNNFDALSVLAYIETKFQDYAVAADLYRKALAVHDSAALRVALANLPPSY